MSVTAIIVSDNHGKRSGLKKVLNRHQDEADFFIHCGDSEFDTHDELIQQFICVKGNCDYEMGYDEFAIVPFGEFGDMFVTHGHMDLVNFNTDRLVQKATLMSPNIRMVCYGHTHQVDVSIAGHILVLNPGSLEFPRDGSKVSKYMKLEVTDTSYEVSVLEAKRGSVIEHFSFDRVVST